MGIYPKGVTCVVEGDVNNGTKRRVNPVRENWEIYNYQFSGDVQLCQVLKNQLLN
jgi:hypothetical protein